MCSLLGMGCSKLLGQVKLGRRAFRLDRKSTRLNSSHSQISYAVFCLKKKMSSLILHCLRLSRRTLCLAAAATAVLCFPNPPSCICRRLGRVLARGPEPRADGPVDCYV